MPDSDTTARTPRFLFPRWSNFAGPAGAVAGIGGLLYLTVLFAYGASPKATAAGYAPVQPVPYSHQLHAGKLGMDCRYCHNTVDRAPFAALPATQTCMNCHTNIKGESPQLLPVRESWASGTPVNWIQVHRLPDYAYFNHTAHVNHGVGCSSCHGRIDHMDVVQQVAPLSMSWCLDCHREPEKNLRPNDQITNMNWKPEEQPLSQRLELKRQYAIRDVTYMQSCSTCHR